VNEKATWQELYQAALLELRPEEMRSRINFAEEAIQQRIAELRQSECSNSNDERGALEDGLRGLRILLQTECKPLPSVSPDTRQAVTP
jgi:hypothetical protein